MDGSQLSLCDAAGFALNEMFAFAVAAEGPLGDAAGVGGAFRVVIPIRGATLEVSFRTPNRLRRLWARRQ